MALRIHPELAYLLKVNGAVFLTKFESSVDIATCVKPGIVVHRCLLNSNLHAFLREFAFGARPDGWRDSLAFRRRDEEDCKSVSIVEELLVVASL